MTNPNPNSKAPPINPRLHAALSYAARGIQVFPAPPGTKQSYKSARHSNGRPWGKTDNAAEIRRDWMRWPDANVCIAMGPDTGPFGLFVLEVDTPKGHNVDGIAALKELEAIHGKLPETKRAISPSGSIHYYFNWPKTGTIKNSASKIGPGIDIRGEGGMVLAPPSIKPNVGEYKWDNPRQVIVDAPDWLLALIIDTTRNAERTPSGDAQANVDLVAAALEVIPNDINDWEEWNKRGMAVYVATGGHDLGFEIFDRWCQKNKAKYNKQNTRDKWTAYGTTPITDITAASIFYWAYEADPDWRRRFEETLHNKPLIRLKSENLDLDADRAEEILADADFEVYEYSGTLVQPITKIVDATKGQKTLIVQLEQITQIYLRRLLNRCIRFMKFNEKKNKYVPCAPPNETADAIIGNKGHWKFEEIVGIASMPTMQDDDALLIEPDDNKEDAE